jgi:hypothetical protein
MAYRSISRDARRAKVLTLAAVRITHTLGSRTTTLQGPELARLIAATRHLHAPEDGSDFIDPSAIAIELDGLAEVLFDLRDDDRPSALGYLSDQLRRLSHRVAALAPRSGNSAPDWYKVEVTK